MSNARKEAHTPTPWFIDALRESRGVAPKFTVCTLSGEEHTIAPTIDATDAAYIVKCVNAHEELVAALRALSEGINTAVDIDDDHCTRAEMRKHLFALQEIAEQALAKAEGGE